MKYKLFCFCPDDQTVIDKIINAASSAGAGVMGNYSHAAFVSKGTGQWFSEPGAHPAIGKVGELTHQQEAKIEMVCDESLQQKVYDAIKKIHPYEEPAIEFIRIEK